MHIMTESGWRLLGGPMAPTPAVAEWWFFPSLGHQTKMVADDRKGIEIILEDAHRLDRATKAEELGTVKHYDRDARKAIVLMQPREANPASAKYNKRRLSVLA